MTRPAVESLTVVLRPVIVSLGVMVLVAGCGDGGIEPDPDDGVPVPVLTLETLEVAPTAADLCAPGPGNTVQLAIVPRDQNGAPLPIGSGTATYSSSAPEIAGVTSSGVVTAAAPGTVMITAAFTRENITRTASMNATVHEGSGEYPGIAGVYDLTAMVTAWDQAFGSPPGTRETAVITIQHSRDSPLFAGTYEDFRWFAAGEESPSYGPVSGSLSGSVNCFGGVWIALRRAQGQNSFWDGSGTLESGQIVGVFGEVGDFGTFTAVRRQTE